MRHLKNFQENVMMDKYIELATRKKYGGTIGCVGSAFESSHREANLICGKLNEVSN